MTFVQDISPIQERELPRSLALEDEMKIIIVGATGALGRAVAENLGADHEIVRVGFNDGDLNVDITDQNSIRELFEQIGPFDALVSATGAVHFGPLAEISQKEWHLGLNNKLMGQINLVMEGAKHVRDGGSFTLTAGIISQDPIRFGTPATTVCAAIEGFAASAALELPRGIRVNVVSPSILQESVEAFGTAFAGFEPVPAAVVAQAFRKSVEGARTGQTFYVKGRT